jgi:hypothetical protein
LKVKKFKINNDMRTQIQKQENVSHTIQSKTNAANQASITQVLQKYKDKTAQREALPDEDELLQGKFDETVPNQTGIPDGMKSGFENMSGFSFDDVRVHYNSDKPAQLNALAYTQGNQVHIAPGQEKHLGHELGHVVQQKQGRVQPTMQLQGVNVNDEEELEKEADVMGTTVPAVTEGEELFNEEEPVQMKLAQKLIDDNEGKQGQATKLDVRKKTQLMGTLHGDRDLPRRQLAMDVQQWLAQNPNAPIIQLKGEFIDNFKEEELVQAKVVQFVPTIKGTKDVAATIKKKLIEVFKLTEELANQVVGKKLMKESGQYNNVDEFIHAKEESIKKYISAIQNSEKVKKTGDDIEAKTANIIGGQINRGRGGKDVEWRIINRCEANCLKESLKISLSNDTDQELFARWDEAIKLFPKYKNELSTPIDAFSSTRLALAGGGSKFDENNIKNTLYRIEQIIKLSEFLKYGKPVLVFSETATCDQCQYIANKFPNVDVLHLDPPTRL